MTCLAPAIGFIPMALAHGAGGKVQNPLATVDIGGLVAATFFTLLVPPAISAVVLGAMQKKRVKLAAATPTKVNQNA